MRGPVVRRSVSGRTAAGVWQQRRHDRGSERRDQRRLKARAAALAQHFRGRWRRSGGGCYGRQNDANSQVTNDQSDAFVHRETPDLVQMAKASPGVNGAPVNITHPAMCLAGIGEAAGIVITATPRQSGSAMDSRSAGRLFLYRPASLGIWHSTCRITPPPPVGRSAMGGCGAAEGAALTWSASRHGSRPESWWDADGADDGCAEPDKGGDEPDPSEARIINQAEPKRRCPEGVLARFETRQDAVENLIGRRRFG